MSTAKQIAANRRNAQKSTGPRTAEGKARTRLNPLKHGLTAETIVLPFESADDYRELQLSVLGDLQPQGVVQQILVERFVQRHWVAQRLARTERAWLQGLYHVHLAEGLKRAKKPKANPEPYLGLAICMQDIPGDPHDLIHKNFFRYRAQIEQDFQRALRALERNQILVTHSEQEPNREIGFVSHNPVSHNPVSQNPLSGNPASGIPASAPVLPQSVPQPAPSPAARIRTRPARHTNRRNDRQRGRRPAGTNSQLPSGPGRNSRSASRTTYFASSSSPARDRRASPISMMLATN